MTAQQKAQLLKDLLCTALEGGSNYWYLIVRSNRKDGEFYHDVPFREDGVLEMTDVQDDRNDDDCFPVTEAMLVEGLARMETKAKRHYLDAVRGDWDAATADVFLQMSVFGEVVYG